MSSLKCGQCEYKGNTRTAKKWCAICQEGLCEDCEKVHKSNKASRDHSLLSIGDYRKMANIDIKQICDQHGSRFDWYCKRHEEALCVNCVSSRHKTCSDIIPPKDACKNVKKSTALGDLEQTIYDALENIKHCIEDRERAIEAIEKESQEIQKYIQVIKQNINKHLDDLSAVKSLQENVNQLGNLTIKESPAALSVRETDQAQIQVRMPPTTISKIGLQLKQKFNIKQKGEPQSITGCIILPDNRILVVDYDGTEKLMEYNDNGQYIRDIPVSYKPCDVTVIDSDRIAVSYLIYPYIKIINIKHNEVQKKIDFRWDCWGISHQDGKLYVSLYIKGIAVTDITGNILNQIKCRGSVDYITTTKDKIFYTDWTEDTIHCYSMGGEIWTFKDKSIRRPFGISVDNDQNVYVVGRDSNNLTLIQHDGTVSKTLLTKDDGLEGPMECTTGRKRIR